MSNVHGIGGSLKILMLHGYTQSGASFRAKTRALEKHVQKAFPGSTFSYPTGPLRLRPSDVPGYDPSSPSDDDDDLEAYGWWRRSDSSDPVEYVGLEDGLATVARTLASEGPFDGVAGFSQGAALAAMISSLLEAGPRSDAFATLHTASTSSIPFPQSFQSIGHPPLRFCVIYSGFIAPGQRYRAFYEPSISTVSCHFIGSLDNVVEESRSQALIEAFGGEAKSKIVYHPGGHFLPSSKTFLDVLTGFIKGTVQESLASEKPKQEERVEDMNMPF